MKEFLQVKIEAIREEMIQTAHQKGLQSVETVALSHQLDSLLNEYETSRQKENIEINFIK